MHALVRDGINFRFFKPIAQPTSSLHAYYQQGSCSPNEDDSETWDRTTQIIGSYSTLKSLQPISLTAAEHLISQHNTDDLLEQIVTRFSECPKGTKVILVEGLAPTKKHPYVNSLNFSIARALNAEIVLVVTTRENTLLKLREHIEVASASFGYGAQQQITGIIVNCLDHLAEEHTTHLAKLSEMACEISHQKFADNLLPPLLTDSPYPLLGYVPWDLELVSARAVDMANHLNATIVNPGEMQHRRLKSTIFCTHTIPRILNHLQPGTLLVTSADRDDVVLAASLAALNGTAIGALLLTGGHQLETSLQKICSRAFNTGLPVFLVKSDIWQTAINLQDFGLEVAVDDPQRIENIQHHVAHHLCGDWIKSLITHVERAQRFSPAAFRHHLTMLARQVVKRIVLPEGEEPRIIRAAVLCCQRGIADCVLLGNPLLIRQIAETEGIALSPAISIIDPKSVRDHYMPRLMELRKHRGMIQEVAQEWLQDNVILATLMLEQGAVDGLVSGAVNTTANTIRPALQLLKTAPGNSLVSSIFFMLLSDQVLVYGDCAINPNPTAEQLATIAIQSADSATAFGIEPRVAMISYSTGDSGAGSDVDKVRTATVIARTRRPDLLIDGPLQYDAAIMPDIAQTKAPNSPVAGRATVFIFPDLNTGNTTYKAVQRSANVLSIGPMLQGLSKPVNDLSRGASVDDIVYTIAVTAIQATQSAAISSGSDNRQPN